MLLKELRNKTNDELLNKLNEQQTKYNKWFDVNYDYGMEVAKRNMDKIKKVLNERNIKIEFVNGWEMK